MRIVRFSPENMPAVDILTSRYQGIALMEDDDKKEWVAIRLSGKTDKVFNFVITMPEACELYAALSKLFAEHQRKMAESVARNASDGTWPVQTLPDGCKQITPPNLHGVAYNCEWI